jgi:hypothetical protein
MSLAEAIETARRHDVAGLTGGHPAVVTTPPSAASFRLPMVLLDIGEYQEYRRGIL